MQSSVPQSYAYSPIYKPGRIKVKVKPFVLSKDTSLKDYYYPSRSLIGH